MNNRQEQEQAIAAEITRLDNFIRTRTPFAYVAFGVSILAELYILKIQMNIIVAIIVFMAGGLGIHAMMVIDGAIKAKAMRSVVDDSISPIFVALVYIALAFGIAWLLIK